LNIRELTTDERLDLIEELWESLETSPVELVLSETQRQELDRRVEEMDRDDNPGILWEEVMSQIRNRRETPNRNATHGGCRN